MDGCAKFSFQDEHSQSIVVNVWMVQVSEHVHNRLCPVDRGNLTSHLNSELNAIYTKENVKLKQLEERAKLSLSAQSLEAVVKYTLN